VNKQKKSLRTTIPMTLVNQWDLTENDYLEWTFKAVEGKMVVEIDKAVLMKKK
jgi:hypothetical protein